MSNHAFLLNSFIHELSDIPSNDQLVNINLDSKNIFPLPFEIENRFHLDYDQTIKSILKVAIDSIKETDVNPLCLIEELLVWTKNEETILTPINLNPLRFKLNKLSNQIQFEIDENCEINPYLKWLWKDWTGTDLPLFENKHLLIKFLHEKSEQENLPFKIIPKKIIGNFHYYRFHILRELEGISKQKELSNPLNQLIGESFSKTILSSFNNYNLLSIDKDQKAVLNALKSENCVLEGPPGTGKTQVIVNLIGKIIAIDETLLLVSEKKSSLDVITKKLAQFELDNFAYVVNSQARNSDFIKHLKKSWSFLESKKIDSSSNFLLSENYYSNFDLLLQRLNDPTTFGGLDFDTFQSYLSKHPIESVHFSSKICSLKEWITWKEQIVELEKNIGSLTLLNSFKQEFFKLEHPDENIKAIFDSLVSIQKHFPVATFADIENLYEKIGRAQLLENDLFEKYLAFETKPKNYKLFLKNINQLKVLRNQLQHFETELVIWKAIPSKTELQSWMKTQGYFEKRRSKKRIQKLLIDSSISIEIAIEGLNTYYTLLKSIEELENYFLETNFSISIHELEIEKQFFEKLFSDESSHLKEIKHWKKEDRKALLLYGNEISFFYKNYSNYFNINTENIELQLQKAESILKTAYLFWKQINKIPESIFTCFNLCNSIDEIESMIVHSNWKLIQTRFPELMKFESNEIGKKITIILQEQQIDQTWFAESLVEKQLKKFHEYEKLLISNSQKISEKDKVLKKNLKKGKAILVAEFSKTRSHKSIRELLTTEAKHWIECLNPIWLSTPTQVADNFPLEKELFEWTIFDEASQIPLPNAFGSLFRSKRSFIAGDSQQMSPSSYFGKKYTFPDLMQQSSYYFTKYKLNYHYRSSHPDLIQFSNAYFYENSLHVFPKPNLENAVIFHKVEKAIFDERKNIQEAKEIAQFLESFNWNKSIGLVAFSEEQLNCILAHCSTKVIEALENQVEKNKGFVKALEKIQGDEADCLVISFGYAFNSEGQFANRFGPVNQTDGHKRLNVLFSRAKEQIDFFSSVTSNDFQLSENESVNLLRKWFVFCENENRLNTKNQLPFDIKAEIKDNQVFIKNACSNFKNVDDLLTFHQTMKNRKWTIKYT